MHGNIGYVQNIDIDTDGALLRWSNSQTSRLLIFIQPKHFSFPYVTMKHFTCGKCVPGLECVPDEDAALLPDLPSLCRVPKGMLWLKPLKNWYSSGFSSFTNVWTIIIEIQNFQSRNWIARLVKVTIFLFLGVTNVTTVSVAMMACLIAP